MFGGWPALRTPALDFSGHTETCRISRARLMRQSIAG